MSHEVVEKLAESGRNLTALNVVGCKGSNMRALKALSECRSLTSLRVSCMHVDVEVVNGLFRSIGASLRVCDVI